MGLVVGFFEGLSLEPRLEGPKHHGEDCGFARRELRAQCYFSIISEEPSPDSKSLGF